MPSTLMGIGLKTGSFTHGLHVDDNTSKLMLA